jgi:hypothetical protein
MTDSLIRKANVVGRRGGRRSLSAYGSHARGIRLLRGAQREGRVAHPGADGRVAVAEGCADGDWSAATALALIYPLARRMRRAMGVRLRGAASAAEGVETVEPLSSGSEGAPGMKRKPSIRSLDTVLLDEAVAYLDYANGDELGAAYALAWDRNRLDGSNAPPDDTEVHHALFLLCRTRGNHVPSFDEMRVELRRRNAA